MITEKDGYLLADVRVVPRSSVNRAEVVDGAVRLKITAPPVDGAANDAVVRFLSDKLGIPKKDISIVKGLSSKNKIVRLSGLQKKEDLLKKLS